MENPLFDCFSDDMKDAVLEVVLKSAISRQGETDGWNALHTQKARDAVCNAARDLLEVYEENFHPGNRINVLQEDEVMEAQGNLLNSMSNSNNNSSNNNSNNNNSSNNNSNNNNSSNNNSNNNNSNNNNSNNNNSNNNNSNNNNSGNKNSNNKNLKGGAKSRRNRKTQRRRRAASRKN